jgi:hypothetical protein
MPADLRSFPGTASQIKNITYNWSHTFQEEYLMKLSRACCPAGTVLLIVLFILTCGCDYVPNHDIIVMKLHPDGSAAWTRTLDTGFDDTAGDIIETHEGELVIAAGNASREYESPSPKLTRLAADGTLLADIPCPSLSGELTSLIQTRDGNLSAATYDGEVRRFDRDGNLIGATPTGMTGVWALAATAGGGIAAAGQSWTQYPTGSVPVYDTNGTLVTRAPLPNETMVTPGCRETILMAGEREIPVTECAAPMRTASQAAVTLLDRNGSILWQKGYGASGLESFWSLAAADGGQEYYLSAFGPVAGPDGNPVNHRYAVSLHGDGSVDWITDLGTASQYYPSPWDLRQGRARVIIPAEYQAENNSTGIRPEAVDFDAGGRITGRIIIPANRIITTTSDNGFFSAGFPSSEGSADYSEMTGNAGGKIHAMKFRADGSREWDRPVGDGTANTIQTVIQTADGGYVILALRQNPV